jgi:uncharacterized protein (TIGR02300 family)
MDDTVFPLGRSGAGGAPRLLTAPECSGKARGHKAGIEAGAPLFFIFCSEARPSMVKPEWGSKRSCPKCATRFYDLGKDDPVSCINCGYAWEPEPVLKSKQPLPFDAPKKEEAKSTDDAVLVGDEDLDIDEGEPSADEDVDLGGDDDLGVDTVDDSDEG